MADANGMTDLKQGQAHSARIYDYFLGGKDNYAADRAAAAQIEQAIPNVRVVARENREFMNRAVGYLGEQGIRQFVDIGTGIPTAPNLHQVAQETARDARVVYVDNDPIVLAHARALLTGTPEGRTQYIEADVTEPAKILAAPQLRDTVDFAEPVALSLIALCHFVPGEQMYDIIDELLAPLVPGSFLVMTHLTADLDPETVQGTVRAYQASGIKMEARTYDGVARFFSGLQLIEPGIVPIGRWYPDGAAPDLTAPGVVPLPVSDSATAPKPPAAGYAAVGRKK
ncbi:SAM-dependent methyltransferase [Nocardia sp. NPDC051052]|uniref:SAM-dependent methyltransferase n=1 Tax=Nocardia sp. NPDC051052 TaxID=3364322 RepID=UPI00379A7790